MNLKGEIKDFNKDEIIFFYRGNNFAKDFIILSVILQGKSLDKKNIQNKQIELLNKKKQAQPGRVKTCSSTFKNTKDKKAWELIKYSNCSGLVVGDASISEKHCNFFINKNKASCKDMKKLINFVKEKVFASTGVRLSLEIILVE